MSTPSPERESRRRMVVKLTKPLGTINVEYIEETSKAADEDEHRPVRIEWQKNRVIWSLALSPLALWQGIKWLIGTLS